MDVPDAIAIMLQVLDALTSAHEQGVVHQDIKPGNIMLTPDHRVKVGDFGISKLMNVETTTIFSTIGTPSYMSPEQCRGDDIVDGRSDIFSAGAMLFEMVAGERAFQGRNVTEVSHRIQNDTLPLLPAHVRNAAPRLQLVLERAMGKHPADRFDTGADMAEALRQVLREAAPDSTRIAPEARRRDGGRAARAARGLRRAQAAAAARSHAAEDGGGKAPEPMSVRSRASWCRQSPRAAVPPPTLLRRSRCRCPTRPTASGSCARQRRWRGSVRPRRRRAAHRSATAAAAAAASACLNRSSSGRRRR